MNTLGKIFSSVSEAFEFNQATLSGSVDIIVVQQPDGSLRSTPFHVRFGKFKVLKSKDKHVHLRVNGLDAGFAMKLGEAGEGFFEEEIIKPVENKRYIDKMEKEVIKVIQMAKEPNITGEQLVIPEDEGDQRQDSDNKVGLSNLNAKQPTNNLAKKLQLGNTLSNKTTSAESKTADDQEVENIYDPYSETEEVFNVKDACHSDSEEVFPLRPKSATQEFKSSGLGLNNQEIFLSKSAKVGRHSHPQKLKKIKVKTLRPSSDKLKSLNLRQGVNTIIYTVQSGLQGSQTVTSNIYFWPNDVNIIISDIDGTITKTDVLGHILPMFGRDWSQPGIAPLYNNIRRNGYHILYLTARPIGQSLQTKKFPSFNIPRRIYVTSWPIDYVPRSHASFC
jgi:phosphatidate phosphatase LPIN